MHRAAADTTALLLLLMLLLLLLPLLLLMITMNTAILDCDDNATDHDKRGDKRTTTPMSMMMELQQNTVDDEAVLDCDNSATGDEEQWVMLMASAWL